MVKLTLDVEEDYHYVLIGLSATVQDYRICWSLNKEFNIGLKRQDDLKLFTKGKEPVFHSFFFFEDEALQMRYRLVKNKKGNSLFLPELKQADYLLIMDSSPALDPYSFLGRVKKLRSVLLAFLVETSELKQKQNLLLAA